MYKTIREDDFCRYIWLTDKMRRIFVDFQMRCLISKSLFDLIYVVCSMVRDAWLMST